MTEARTVARAADVLRCFTAERPEWRIADFARELTLSKTIVRRLLETLQSKGFVARNAVDRTFSPGPASLGLAAAFLGRGDLIARSQGPMRELWEALGETVALSIRAGDHRFCVHQLESPHALRYSLPLSQPMALYGGATGKLFLASMSDAEINAYLRRTPLVRRAPRTIVDRTKLWKEIRLIRARGYATGTDEGSPGGAGIAALILGAGGAPGAALSVTGPTTRIGPRRFGEIAPRVVEAARLVSARMGATLTTPPATGWSRPRNGRRRIATLPS